MEGPALLKKLAEICEDITRGEYDRAKTIFDLSPCQAPAHNHLNFLVEALGMMLVRIEAREFELERTIAELTAAREDLIWHKERLAQENTRLQAELRQKAKTVKPVASSQAMLAVMRQAERAAMIEATLLLTGETGTGKGLLAKHIHETSSRAGKPFVAINCAAIPASLLESELFGIEAGVASGVQARVGRFEQAAKGTILLDEIGDMPLESQAKLLQVIETGQVERIGGRKPINIGVRIMAATHHDLEHCVANGTFRADLFYRLNVMRLHLPPLRERREDIPLLVRVFLTRLAESSPQAITAITPEALAKIRRYDWPGNIRQLENELERAAWLSPGPQILPGDFSNSLAENGPLENDPNNQPAAPPLTRIGEEKDWLSSYPVVPSPVEADDGSILTLEEMEDAHIANVLNHLGGNKSRAAKALNISREGLRVRLQKMAATPQAIENPKKSDHHPK